MEQFYGFARSIQLLDANCSLRVMEQALKLGCFDIAAPAVRSAVEGYNDDACVSLSDCATGCKRSARV